MSYKSDNVLVVVNFDINAQHQKIMAMMNNLNTQSLDELKYLPTFEILEQISDCIKEHFTIQDGLTEIYCDAFRYIKAEMEPLNVFSEWNTALVVERLEIDETKEILVNLVNEMHHVIYDQYKNFEAHERIASSIILEKLVAYTKHHFAVEGSLMRLLEYPTHHVEVKQQQPLLQDILSLHEKIATGAVISFEYLHFLKLWLTKHMMEADNHYTEYFHEYKQEAARL